MGKPDDPSTAGGNKRKDNRKTFSVSKGFSDIHDILDSLPDNESSRFICEAIRHYHQYKNNPNWMGEQLQSIIAMTTQLQQAMAGLGNVGFPPSLPFPQVGSALISPVGTPNMSGNVYAQPQGNIQHHQESVQPSQSIVDEVAVASQSAVNPSVTRENTSTPIETATGTKDDSASGEDAMAVESENRYRTSQSNPSSVGDESVESQTQPTRPRRRSGMASALATKSMGVKHE